MKRTLFPPTMQESEIETMKKPSRLHWLLPLLFALPMILAGAFAVALYGSELYNLVMIALKLVVTA